MPPRAQWGGEAGLMLINEYLTLKFNFHLLVSETRLCQRCRRCLGFFPKVNSSSNLEKKKKWEISSLKDRHAACSTCCMLAAQPPSSIGLELMQQRKSSPDRCRVSCSEPFCCRNVVLLVMLTLSSGVETGTFTAASFYRHHVIGNFMWKIYLVPWWKK